MDAIASTAQTAAAAPAEHPSHLWANGDSMSFHDVLDAINPLQHLPVVSAIYRAVTGDKIGNVARVAGDALYGGAVGFVFGLANAGIVSETGKDLGEHLQAFVKGDPDELNQETAPFQGDEFTHGTPALFGSAKRKAEAALASVKAQPDAAPPTSTVAPPAADPTAAGSAAPHAAPVPPTGPVDLPYFPDSSGKPLVSETAPHGTAPQPNTPSNAPDTVALAPPVTAGATQKAASAAKLYQAQSTNLPANPPASAGDAPTAAGAIPATLPRDARGIALASHQRFIPIDTSQDGIAAMRASSAQHGTQAVSFTPPSGTVSNALRSGQTAAPVVDFADRMRQGLDKYNALILSRTGSHATRSATRSATGSATGSHAASDEGQNRVLDQTH